MSERETRAIDVLRRLAAKVDGLDEFSCCMLCGSKRPLIDNGRYHVAGPCSDDHCISHEIAAVLADPS